MWWRTTSTKLSRTLSGFHPGECCLARESKLKLACLFNSILTGLYSEEQRKLGFNELQEKIDAETQRWWKDTVCIGVYAACV